MKKYISIVMILSALLNFCSCSEKFVSGETLAEYNQEETTTAVSCTTQTTGTTTIATTTKKTTTTTTTTTTVTSATTIEKKNNYVCLEVPYVSQRGNFPTGCEIVSTSMLLQYHGFDVTAGKLIDDGYIVCQETEYDNKKDKAYFANPEEAFVGNPRSSSGYGCYSPVIINTLEKYIEDSKKKYETLDLSGESLEKICKEHIDYGEPVLIWASISMVATEEKEDSKWLIKGTKEKFKWISNEHCLVLVGYDDKNYYFNDPLKWAKVTYAKETVEKRYEELGKQAVTIRPF